MARYGVRFENDPSLTPQDFQELARLAEDRGYEMVWVPEGGGRDSLTALSAIAMVTERVQLATGILPVFARTAINTAMGAAGMAAVSGNRFILGLGVGHRPAVESRDGVPFRQPMTRLRETISIVRSLLAGEQVSYSGKHFNTTNASLGAAAPDAKVPIYIAALGPQMLELAGEMADGVLMNWTAASITTTVQGGTCGEARRAARRLAWECLARSLHSCVSSSHRSSSAGPNRSRGSISRTTR